LAGEPLQFRKIKAGGVDRPLRYWPALLIAIAIAESVHAPLIGQSSASASTPDVLAPSNSRVSPPPVKPVKGPQTLKLDPFSLLDESRPSVTPNRLDPSWFDVSPPQLLSRQSNLLPDNLSENLPAEGVPAADLPTVSGAWDPPGEDGFSGNVEPNRIISQLPINPGRVHEQKSVSTPTVTSVPEPGVCIFTTIGTLRLLRRRR
jgi:hypothetical protein